MTAELDRDVRPFVYRLIDHGSPPTAAHTTEVPGDYGARLGVVRRTFVLLLLALPVSACAGNDGDREPVSEAEYRRALATAFQDVGRRIDQVEAVDTTGDETEAQGKLLLEALGRQVDALDEIEPPEDVASDHEDLVEGLDELGDHVGSELEALEKETDVNSDEVEDRLFRSPSVEPTIQKIQEAGGRLVEAGYAPDDGLGSSD